MDRVYAVFFITRVAAILLLPLAAASATMTAKSSQSDGLLVSGHLDAQSIVVCEILESESVGNA